MARIRNTIELLVNILQQNGLTELKAETFRLAKFDDDNATAPLWHLLYELTSCELGKVNSPAHATCTTDLLPGGVVGCVKRAMWRRGFQSADFSRLPGDMAAGSRELLLAVAWLLGRDDVINRFMTACSEPLDQLPAALLTGAVSERRLVGVSDVNASPAERVQRLLWINNKLQLSLRGLLALQCEWRRLAHRVHEATMGVSLSSKRNHLSLSECHMLRHPVDLELKIVLLDKDNERLQNLLKWKSVEDVFWKWMESVLDAKIQNVRPASVTEPRSLLAPPAVAAEYRHLQRSRRSLEEAIVTYEAIVTHLEKLWESKKCSVSSAQLDAVIEAMESELQLQLATLPASCTARQRPTQPLCRRPTEPAFVYRPTSSGVAGTRAGDIEGEIDALQGLVDGLTGELQARQRHYTTQMHQLAANMPNAVCIPPLQKRQTAKNTH